MEKNSKVKKIIDLSFAAVSFTCVLQIFTNSTQSNYSLKSADAFAVFLPLLIGASVAEDVVRAMSNLRTKEWVKYIRLVIFMISIIAILGCCYGIYLFFCAISQNTGRLFLDTSLLVFSGLMVFTIIISFIDVYIFHKEKRQAQQGVPPDRDKAPPLAP